MISRFFKGLVYTGAWCVFDEFNRINIEVLSVIAQYLLQVLGAKILPENQPFEFEGSTINKIEKTFSIFITMNPGYKGKVELPDNLKSLFRIVVMMTPDYQMIIEILLYSYGFQEGKNLS
jgi:dynein heavy chain, axonemal